MSELIRKLTYAVRQTIASETAASQGVPLELINGLLEAWDTVTKPAERNQLWQLIECVRYASPKSFQSRLLLLAHDREEKGRAEEAETAYRLACAAGVSENAVQCRAQLADFLRRKSKDPLCTAEAMSLLIDGAAKSDVLSVINMALLLTLDLSGKEDWALANRLIQMLPDDEKKLEFAEHLWQDRALKGEIEGYLVHFLLLYGKKLRQSDLGPIASLEARLKNSLDAFPEELYHKQGEQSFDLDALIARIDAKIEELEREEKAANQADDSDSDDDP